MLQWVIAEKGEVVGREILRAISEKSRNLFFDISVNSGASCLTCEPGEELVFVEDLLREATTYKHIGHIGDVSPYGQDVRHIFWCH